MAFNGKSSVTAAQNDLHRAILRELLRQEPNRRCADCGSRGPTWASVNLGVFVCLNCSGEPLLPRPTCQTPRPAAGDGALWQIQLYLKLVTPGP